MLHRPIGLPAAAALSRRGVGGVDGIPADAALHLIDVPDDESVESGAWEAWLDSGGDEDDTEDGGAGAAGVTFNSVLRWLWIAEGRHQHADTDVLAVSAAYRAAVEWGSPPEFAAHDRAERAAPPPAGAPVGPKPTEKVNPGEYWAHQIYAHRWPEDVQAHASDAVRAHHKGDSAATVERLYGLGACDGWTAISTGLKCFVRTLLADGAGLYPGVLQGTIGMLAHGTWAAPVDAPVAVSETPPWAPLATDTGAQVEPWRGVGRGLAVFDQAVTSIAGPPKAGKTMAVWADLAPVTVDRQVLAIVGSSERGPGSSYAGTIAALGGDPRNVQVVEPRAGIVEDIAAHIEGSGIVAVVVDTAASLCSALGVNENNVAEVRPLIDRLRTWGVPVVINRHTVNAGSDPANRDRGASRGAGSRDWFAAVDGEATLTRNGDGKGSTSTLEWRARTGAPDVSRFTLDTSTTPWSVQVEDVNPNDPFSGGGGGESGPTEGEVDQTLLDILRYATPEVPLLLGVVREKVASTLKREKDQDGRWFLPYRRGIDRGFKVGAFGASRDPAERRPGSPLKVWMAALESAAEAAPEHPETKVSPVSPSHSREGGETFPESLSTPPVGRSPGGREGVQGGAAAEPAPLRARGETFPVTPSEDTTMQTPDANGEILVTQAQGRTLLDWWHKRDVEVWSVLCPGGVAVEPTEATWAAVKALMPPDPDMHPTDALEFCWAAEDRARNRLRARLGNPAHRADILDIVSSCRFQELVDRPLDEWPNDVIRVLGSTRFGQPAQES